MNKLSALRKQFGEYNIDGLLVTDSYNRRYITEFTGTTGLAIISF